MVHQCLASTARRAGSQSVLERRDPVTGIASLDYANDRIAAKTTQVKLFDMLYIPFSL